MKKLSFAFILLIINIYAVQALNAASEPSIQRIGIPQSTRTDQNRVELKYYDVWTEGTFTSEVQENMLTYAAIEIPATTAQQHQGKPLDCISIEISEAGTNAFIFLSYDLNAEPFKVVHTDFIDHSTNVIRLVNPYIIEGKRFFIGYAQTGKNPVAIETNVVVSPLANWIGYEENGQLKWRHLSELRYNANNCIKGIINCSSTMQFYHLGNINATSGDEITIEGIARNLSKETINNFEISCELNNQITSHTIHKAIEPNAKTSFTFTIPALNKTGEYTAALNLIAANGAPASMENNQLSCNISCKKRELKQNMVVEEFTGTWCQNCPRGIVAMKEMKERYPDRFIGIAVHDRDSYQTNTYDDILNAFKEGLPSCVVNRDVSLTRVPSVTRFENAYNKLKNIPALAEVIIKEANFTDENRTTIHVQSESRFAQDLTTGVRIAFVLLENGPIDFQQNIFSGGGHGAMGGFEYLDSRARISLQDIARELYGGKEGIPNSLPTSVNSSDVYNFEYDLTLPSTIENKDSLEVVALLIDQQSGKILNGCKAIPNQEGSHTNIAGNRQDKICVYAEDNHICCNIPEADIFVFKYNGEQCPNQNLPSGIYIVRIITKHQAFTKKIKI